MDEKVTLGSSEVPSFVLPTEAGNNADLSELKKLIHMKQRLELQVHELSQELKDKEAELRQIDQTDIPEFLMEAGLSEIKLDTGEKVIVKTAVKASVTKANFKLFYEWLKARGDEAIVKESVSLADPSPEVVNQLHEMGVPVVTDRNVHYATLNAYIKKAEEAGIEVPDFVSVFHVNKTTIK